MTEPQTAECLAPVPGFWVTSAKCHLGVTLAPPHAWPGEWRSTPPQIDEHTLSEPLVWAMRPVGAPYVMLVRSHADCAPQWAIDHFEKVTRIEVLDAGGAGRKERELCLSQELEWCGPLMLPPTNKGNL